MQVSPPLPPGEPDPQGPTPTVRRRPADDPYVVRFVHMGRNYTLLKRKPNRDAPYYLDFEHRKRRFKTSLQTNDKRTATERAKLIITRIRNEMWDNLSAIRAKPDTAASTIGQVCDLFVSHSTAHAKASIVRAVHNIIQEVHPDASFNVRAFSLDGVNADLAHRYQLAMIARYKAKASPDQASQKQAAETAMRSSRSRITQARCLFSSAAGMIEKYQRDGLVIPDCVNGFMNAKLAGSSRGTEYNPPSDQVIADTFEKVESLKKKNPDAYLAFWFAIGAGLRRSEFNALHWEHLVEREGVLWVSGGIGKDGERIEVPVQARAAVAIAPLRQQLGRVAHGTSCAWANVLSRFMVSCGFNSKKKMHELRAYVGSLLYRQNPVHAMRFMRHKSVLITERFYVRYSTQAEPIQVI